MKLKIIVFLLATLCCGAYANAATYYLANISGTYKYRSGAWPDASNGTTTTTVQTAMNAIGTGGHTLVLAAGTYTGAAATSWFDVPANLTLRSVESGDDAYPQYAGTVILTGADSTTYYAIRINNANGATVRGLTINGPTRLGNLVAPIYIGGTSANITLDNLIIKANSNDTGSTYNCAVRLASTGLNNVLKNSTIQNMTYGTFVENGLSSTIINGYGIYITGANWSVINNTIGGGNYRFRNGITLNASSNSIIQGNQIKDSWSGVEYSQFRSSVDTAFGIQMTGTCNNNKIIRNRITGCNKGISGMGTSGGTLIAYNIIERSHVNGIDLVDNNLAGAYNEVYNNTIYHRPSERAGHGIAIQLNPGKAKIKNNLCDCYTEYSGSLHNINCISLTGSGSIMELNNNIWWNRSPGSTCRLSEVDGLGTGGDGTLTYQDTLAQWQTAIANDTRVPVGSKDNNSQSTDPILVDSANGNYTPSNGLSSAINNGLNSLWSGLVSIVDFFSTPITDSSGNIAAVGGTVDIGAIEMIMLPGACGSYNGLSFYSLANGNCSVGTPTGFSGAGPWTWTCAGLNGGAPSGTCTAYLAQPLSIIPGINSTYTVVGGAGTFTWSYLNQPAWFSGTPGGTNNINFSVTATNPPTKGTATLTVTDGAQTTTTRFRVGGSSGGGGLGGW